MSTSRRELLQGIAATAVGSVIPRELWMIEKPQETLPVTPARTPRKPEKPVTAIILGHGGRGGYYSWMGTNMPDYWKIVGVADPIDYRREDATNRHKLPSNMVFNTWEDVLKKPKMADVMVVSTQDAMHLEPAKAALAKGYHLLLEKPIAQSYKQCEEIQKAAHDNKRMVAICHVLRYAPFMVKIKQLIDAGVIGDVISIQHMEPVHYLHFAHSYVRGPWHNTKDSNPSLLAKSCHDLDLISWWMGSPCTRVTSFGGVKMFQKKNAPVGAPSHCSKGCPIEKKCIYQAQDVYVYKKRWGTHHIITRDRSDEGILKAMKGTQYDACVYNHRNDVCDHQVVNMEFANGASANFTMQAMTSYGGRRTRIFGTKGDIVGDEQFLDVYNFERQSAVRWDVATAGTDLGGHGGGDVRMVQDFAQAIAFNDPSWIATNIDASMESHKIGFLAEESRRKGGAPMRVH